MGICIPRCVQDKSRATTHRGDGREVPDAESSNQWQRAPVLGEGVAMSRESTRSTHTSITNWTTDRCQERGFSFSSLPCCGGFEELTGWFSFVHSWCRRTAMVCFLLLTVLGSAVSAVTPVLRKALWKELGATIQDPEATVKLQILSKLLPPPGSKGLHNLMDCLPAAPERAGNEESWAVADAISTVLKNSEELHSWRRHLFSACIKGLVAMYSSSKDEGKQEVERSMLLRLEELLCVVEEVDPDDWCDLVKTGLKYRYRDETFLKVLNVAIQLLYMKESSLRA
nr:nucleolar pre-ribosomal-associated protein 1 isoform X2 [Taeniopygia guttata]